MDDTRTNIPAIGHKMWEGLRGVLTLIVLALGFGILFLEGAMNMFFGAALQEIVSIDETFSVKVPYSWASDVALARNYSEYTLWASDKRLFNFAVGKSEPTPKDASAEKLAERYGELCETLWPGVSIISEKSIKMAACRVEVSPFEVPEKTLVLSAGWCGVRPPIRFIV